MILNCLLCRGLSSMHAVTWLYIGLVLVYMCTSDYGVPFVSKLIFSVIQTVISMFIKHRRYLMRSYRTIISSKLQFLWNWQHCWYLLHVDDTHSSLWNRQCCWYLYISVDSSSSVDIYFKSKIHFFIPVFNTLCKNKIIISLNSRSGMGMGLGHNRTHQDPELVRTRYNLINS